MIALPLDEFLNRVQVVEKRSLSQWMTEELVIPEGDCKGQLYDLETRSFAKLLVDAVGQYRQLWISASPRTGKSLWALGVGLWRVCEYGESVQVIAPDQKIVWDFFKDKIEPALLSNPRLAALLPAGYEPTESAKPTLRFRNGGVLRLIFNPATIRSYDAICTIGTEASLFQETRDEADIVSLAFARMADHPNDSLAVMESTPSRTSTRMAQEVKRGTNSMLVCPCPHCNESFEVGARETISGWDVETEDLIDCHIVCPHCKARIDESHRAGMLRNVSLVHRTPTAKAFSATINWFHGKTTFEDVGLSEWKHKHSPSLTTLRDLYQRIYALPVSDEMEQPEISTTRVTKELLIERMAGYKSGEVPTQALFCTAAIDVQQKWLYTCVQAHDSNGGVYWIDWSAVEIVPYELQKQMAATPQMVLNALEAAYQEVSKFNPVMIFCDSSYKHDSTEIPLVRQWCAKYSNVSAIAGRAHSEMTRMDKISNELPAQVRDFIQIRPQPNKQLLWFLDVDRLKSSLSNRILMPKGSAGGVYFPSDLTEKGRDWLIRHLLSEEPHSVRGRNGMMLTRWEPIKGMGRNDLWDCSTYAYASGLFVLAAKGITPAMPQTQQKAKPKEAPQKKQNQPPAPTTSPMNRMQPRAQQRPVGRPQMNRRTYGF